MEQTNWIVIKTRKPTIEDTCDGFVWAWPDKYGNVVRFPYSLVGNPDHTITHWTEIIKPQPPV